MVHKLISAELARHDHSFVASSRYIYLWCCSSCTPRSWWITQSTQHHRRDCNNIPSFLQQTAPIARSLCGGWTPFDLHIMVTAPFFAIGIPSGMCTKLRTVAASNNRDHRTRSLSSSPLASTINCSPGSQALLEVTHQDHSIGITLLLLVRATYIYGVVLHAHPVRGESHNQRNTTGEVATLLNNWQTFLFCILRQNIYRAYFVFWGKISTEAILPVVEHDWLKWSCNAANTINKVTYLD